MPRSRPSPLRMILRGVVQRCPRCGGGHLFHRWITMVERCPRCGMKFEREDGFFLGAFVVNFGVVLISLGVFIGVTIASTLPDPPVGLLSAAAMLFTVLVAVGFYPSSKTVWSAFDLSMRWLDAEEERTATEAVRAGTR